MKRFIGLLLIFTTSIYSMEDSDLANQKVVTVGNEIFIFEEKDTESETSQTLLNSPKTTQEIKTLEQATQRLQEIINQGNTAIDSMQEKTITQFHGELSEQRKTMNKLLIMIKQLETQFNNSQKEQKETHSKLSSLNKRIAQLETKPNYSADDINHIRKYLREQRSFNY